MYTAEELRAAAWAFGEIESLDLLDSNQVEINRAFRSLPPESQIFVLNCSRQMGKSYWLTALCIGYAFEHNDAQIKFATHSQKSASAIIRPLFRQILATCPRELRPRYDRQDGEWKFKNGSTITVAGLNVDDGDRLRGQRAHLFVIDEAREVKQLEYAIQDIALPQLLTTGGRIVLASTPPASSGHDFVRYLRSAQAEGSYVHRTIYDNPRLDESTIARHMKQAGGRDSITWRREYLAEVVTDSNRAIVPEWDDRRALECVREVPKPAFWDGYVGADYGFVDATGVLWSWWDFREQRLVIERELLMRRMTTPALAAAMTENMKLEYGESYPEKRPYVAVLDAPDILHADLSAHHGLLFVKPDKTTSMAARVSTVRELVGNNQLVVHPRCKQLIRQLHEGVWDERREDFERNNDGHYDLLAALVYLVRTLQMNRNPFPANYGVTDWDNVRRLQFAKQQSQGGKALAGALLGKK